MNHNIIDPKFEKFTKVLNTGVTLFKNKKYKESITKYLDSLKYSYNDNEAKSIAYYYIGLSQMGTRDFQSAVRDFHKAIEYSDNKEYYYDLGLAYLSNGNLEEGMKRYKYRYFRQNDETPQFPALPLPFYQGLDFNEYINKNVLVYREQGLGDEIMFSTSLANFSKIVKKAFIQVNKINLEFFKNKFSHLENLSFYSDYEFTLEEVQQYNLCTAFGNIFYQHYLKFPVELNKKEVVDFSSIDKKENVKIGFCISGNPETRDYNEKRIKLNDFFNLMEKIYPNIDIDYYNLDINNEYDFCTNIKDLSSSMHETSLIIKGLDVVYSIDTAVLHLSHLLQKNTYHLHYDYVSWIWNYSFYDNQYKNIKI